MKNPTIWESASRPLFVRTVWLEGSELRRGLQRHFLLDYDTERPLERVNSAIKQKRTDILNRSISLELNDFTNFDDFTQGEEEVFLIGSAQVKLHEPFKLNTNQKKIKPLKYHKRIPLDKNKYPSYDSYNFASSRDMSRRPSVVSDLYSRKNSLTQPQQSDELLAEKVLHWLDLAGKKDFLQNLHEHKEMEVKLSKTSKLRQAAIKRYNTKLQNNQKSKHHKTKSNQRATTAAPLATTQRNHKSSESVKHITIIFDKQGQPIRLNRPGKNIDFYSLTTSPGTSHRLADTLASTRLYKSAENPRCFNSPKKPYVKYKTGNEGNKSLSAHRRLDTVADLTNCTLQKRLLQNSMQGSSYNNLHDSKKQLHIFMPTLPKKGSTKSAYGTEDGISELSHNFSELCRI